MVRPGLVVVVMVAIKGVVHVVGVAVVEGVVGGWR